MAPQDHFGTKTRLITAGGTLSMYNITALTGLGDIDALPYSIKVLLESCVRNYDGYIVTEDHVKALAGYDAKNVTEQEIAFKPGRVVLQDFTGVPAIVDFAALRSAMQRLGGDTAKVNPLIRADLVIDHSVQVDAYGTAEAMATNTRLEFERNQERYEFLKWGQQSLSNFSVVPPATGIVHQVNLEYLAGGVLTEERDGEQVALPDSLVGTDSHTTMINGLGVVGWGVGGIEAEACMLGQPIYMKLPEVVGFELTGGLKEGTTATDVVLTVTQMLRKHGVVEKFVEFYGEGVGQLSLADRATIANMAPEYGATIGFFPVDDKTLDYLRLSGRAPEQVELVEKYCKRQGLWRDDARKITYTSNLSLDLDDVQPSLAGPKRPQDRITLRDMKKGWQALLAGEFKREVPSAVATTYKGESFDLQDGAVVIAAITSCTNTSNPAVMIAAGLVAKKARALGLVAKPWVKTSLAPGSRVVTDYLQRAGLLADLEAVGFYTVGYGCTTCIGNSGPLSDPIIAAIKEGDLNVASVLSGNRNFEGRVSPQTRANYLASPPLVVAYAIAGTVDWNPYKDAIGEDKDGEPVTLADIWPTNHEIAELMLTSVTREQFVAQYANVYLGPPEWQALSAEASAVYAWNDASTYVQEPPFFVGMSPEVKPIAPIVGARALALLGDSVTTDHISPAGAIPPGSPAARYLEGHGVAKKDWNSFGSRRGNDRVMTRGTFGNIRIKNRLAPGTEGGYTTYLGPDADPAGPFPGLTYDSDVAPKHGAVAFIYDAAVKYQKHGVPLVVLAGKDYGMGSSRDWAAKGTYLLGVKAVIAESYERIHRSNLIGMGVLPLQFTAGQTAASLGLTGHETFAIPVDDGLEPLSDVTVTATAPDGGEKRFTAKVRIDTPVEVEYYRNGGILHTVLRRLASA
ncbi:MAG: aconitate hydratase AcnA [Deltaproteobacteria bacterium HGW-Deltaproteobacteria-14]|jgi:aconitate hydratase|nr:MAG: aconitate hydratase AcnA [Deltaproteobacteria bacterium HGW-Deltaproteobacteria-14]